MIREKAVPERWAGPHVDQNARDLLDDHGLVPTGGGGGGVGVATHRLEVVV